jgi:ubiquinone biosynthesis monooxygenase Coq6
MIYVWDSCSLANLSFDRSSEDSLGLTSQSHDNHMMSEDHMMLSEDSDASDDVMGYIVENNVILKALSDKVKECNNITIQRGVTIKSLDSNDGQQQRTVTFTDGSTLHTSLLVGADGPSSSVREMSGLGVVGWSYNQHGVVANLKVEEAGPNEVAWQRFLPDGPIALLPLTDDQCSMVWSTTPSHATHLLEMTEEQFVNSVNAALFDDYPIDPVVNASNTILKDVLSSIGTSSVRRLPPTVSGADGRGKFSLSFSHSPHYVKSRLALIGDAGHRVHPLAGLGVNLGFNDVTSLYDILLADTVAGIEWGKPNLSHHCNI